MRGSTLDAYLHSTRRQLILTTLISLAIASTLVALWYIDPDLYIRLSGEDAPFENLTAAFYGIAGIGIALAVGLERVRGRTRLIREIPVIVAALGFIYIAGEEISWGQRLLGLDTPEFFRARNLQNEITTHNLEIFSGNSLFNQHRLLNVFVALSGIVLPLAVHWNHRVRSLCERWNIPVVPLRVSPILFVGLLYGQTIAKLSPHWAHPEVKETIFSLGYLVFAWSYVRARLAAPAETERR